MHHENHATLTAKRRAPDCSSKVSPALAPPAVFNAPLRGNLEALSAWVRAVSVVRLRGVALRVTVTGAYERRGDVASRWYRAHDGSVDLPRVAEGMVAILLSKYNATRQETGTLAGTFIPS